MAAVNPDLIQDSRLLETRQGQVIVRQLKRTFHVEGLSGDASSRLLEARIATGIPAQGEAHPNEADLFAISYDVVPLDNQQAKVIVTYQNETNAGLNNTTVYESDGALVSVQTNTDLNGNPLVVEWDGDKLAKQNPMGIVLRPRGTDIRSKLMSVTPEQKNNWMKNWLGGVNSGFWNGGSPRTWLCTNIKVQFQNMSATYGRVTFIWTYAPETWDSFFPFIDPNTGKPMQNDTPRPSAPGKAKGWLRVCQYPQVSFVGVPV